MMLVNRVNVINGETSIYDRYKRPLTHYTLSEAMEAAIVNDEQVMHGVTPIIQLDQCSLATGMYLSSLSANADRYSGVAGPCRSGVLPHE